MKLLAVILAGGKSTRMGQDKALLHWKSEETLLAHQIKTLQKVVGKESVLVSGVRDGYRCVPDLEVGCGPLEGIRSVLLELSQHYKQFCTYFVPVDMPLLTPWDLEMLKAESDSEDAITFLNMNLPVLICNPHKILMVIDNMRLSSHGKNFSLKELFAQVKVKRIHREMDSHLMNINTPEDLKNALSKTDKPS